MVLTVKIRQGIVLGTTGMFFVVAALGQMNGASGTDAFVKAGIACLVVVCLSIAFLSVIEPALRVSTGAAHAQTTAKIPRSSGASQLPQGE